MARFPGYLDVKNNYDEHANDHNEHDADGVDVDDGVDEVCVHRHEGRARSSGTAHCSIAAW